MRGGRPSQGEAITTWVVWLALALLVVVTYSRVDPAHLYNVSREGPVGGLSRVLTLLNYPISLVAIPLTLVACAALPRRAWWVGAPAVALSAVTTVPGVLDQDDLDARWVNVVPAAGVALAAALAIAAAMRAGPSFASRRPGDRLRIVAAAIVGLISLPWIAAEAGFHLPGDVFMGEELGIEDGKAIAAVHLGGHHGTYGALMFLSALLLSRVAVAGRTGAWLGALVAGVAGYGLVNMTEDVWHEQLVKRGWVDWKIPSAVLPGARPIWLVVLGVAVAFWLLVRLERRRSPALA